MKKLALMLAVIMLISLSTNAFAASREIRNALSLTFSGPCASCEVSITGNSMADHIDVTMKLMYGSTCVAYWTGSGDGYLSLSKTAAVTASGTYVLTVDVYISGIRQVPLSTSATASF